MGNCPVGSTHSRCSGLGPCDGQSPHLSLCVVRSNDACGKGAVRASVAATGGGSNLGGVSGSAHANCCVGGLLHRSYGPSPGSGGTRCRCPICVHCARVFLSCTRTTGRT